MDQIKYAIGKKVEYSLQDTKKLSDVVTDQTGEIYYKIFYTGSNVNEMKEHIDGLRERICSLLLLKIIEINGRSGSEYKVLEFEEI